MLRRALRDVSTYSVASALGVLAGLISFPFLTRVLSNADYGLLAVISAGLTLGVGLAKLGQQHAVVRFLPEAKEADGRAAVAASAIVGMCSSGLIALVLWLAIGLMLSARGGEDAPSPLLVAICGLLLWVRVITSGAHNLLVAERQSLRVAVLGVLGRYAHLGVMIVMLLYIRDDVSGFFEAALLVEAVMLLVLLKSAGRQVPHRLQQFDPALLKRMLVYGVPTMGAELCAVLISLGDRFVLAALAGLEVTSLYAANYNLAEYFSLIAVAAVWTGVVPAYMQAWEREGRERTEQLLSDLLALVLIIGLPIVAGAALIGADVVRLLATERYVPGAAILPWVLAGMVLNGAMAMTAAGYLIQRRTRSLFLLNLGAAGLNVLGNLLLIPRFGLLGAAYATLLSYAFMFVWASVASRRLVRVRFDLRLLSAALAATLFMAFAVDLIVPVQGLLRILLALLLAPPLYALALLAFSRRSRALLRAAPSLLRGRAAPGA